MSNSMLADPKIAMTHQIDVIRDYARRMVMQGENWNPTKPPIKSPVCESS